MHLILVVILCTVLVRRPLSDDDDVIEEEHVSVLGLDTVVLSEVKLALSDELPVSLESKRERDERGKGRERRGYWTAKLGQPLPLMIACFAWSVARSSAKLLIK